MRNNVIEYCGLMMGGLVFVMLQLYRRGGFMAIYDIFEYAEKGENSEMDSPLPHVSEMKMGKVEGRVGGHIFSSIAARLLFFVLLIADIAWGVFSCVMFSVTSIGGGITGFKLFKLRGCIHRSWLNVKRACVCGVSLFVSLFSPALGMMFAYTYFLMYDKRGIEEVVPSVLREHFKEFLDSNH